MNRFKSFDSWLNNKSISESETQTKATQIEESEVQEPTQAETSAPGATSASAPTISDDVENIMNSLEVLSSELTESIDIEIESILNEEFDGLEAINENFLEAIKKQIMSMKAYATLQSVYPKFKKDENKKKVQKITALGQYDLDSEDAVEKLKEQTREKFEKAIEKAKQDQNAAKRKVAVQKLRDARDEALKVGKESSIQKKIDAGKAKLTKKMDQTIAAATKDVNDLLSKQKIESELMKAQWDSEKIEIDNKLELDLIDQETEAQLQFAGDSPEAQKRIQNANKKAAKQVADETARKAAEANQDLKELSDEYERISSEGDEKQKAANAKIKAFFDNGRTYAQQLSASLGASADGEPSKEVKAALINARKEYNAAKNAITAGTFTVADPKLSKVDADEQFETFKKMIDDQVSQYDDKVKGFEKETDDNEDEDVLTDDQKQKIQAEETQMAERQEQLDAELAKPEEEQNQGKIEGLKAGIAKNKEDIAAIKSNQNNSVVISDLGNDLSEEVETEEVEEGNAFGDAVRKAKEAGEDEFEFEGETYKVEESENDKEEEEPKEVVEESCEACNCNPCECAKESLVNRATAAGLTELAQDIATKENWQVVEGTTLRAKYTSIIKKAESDKILLESRYLNNSVKDAFRNLM